MAEACRTPSPESTPFIAVEFDDQRVNELLGETARRLLAVGGEHRRHGDGETHALKRQLARMAGCNAAQLTQALRLLTRVGLHRYLGRRRRVVPHGQQRGQVRWRARLVPVRTLGEGLVQNQRTGLLRTPWGLRQALEQQASRIWGGRRAGAGRPRKQPEEIKTFDEPESGRKLTSRLPSEDSKTRAPARSEIQANPKQGGEPSPPCTPEQLANGRPGGLSQKVPAMAPPRPTSTAAAPLTRELPVVPERRSRLRPEARVFGLELRQRIQALGARLLPPAPTAQLIPTVQVPPPAELPAGLSDVDAVAFLARAYRGAVQRAFGTASMFMLRGELEQHKDFERVLFAARAMQAAGIAPAAWVQFSFAVWAEHGPKGKRQKFAPTVAFVFSAKRLAERVEWFEQQRDRWSGGQMLLASEHRALCEDHQAMWCELMIAAPTTREAVAAVVDRWFPSDAWERRVALAKFQAAELAQRVRRQTEAGALG